MGQFNHPNVIALIGVVTQSRCLAVFVELIMTHPEVVMTHKSLDATDFFFLIS